LAWILGLSQGNESKSCWNPTNGASRNAFNRTRL